MKTLGGWWGGLGPKKRDFYSGLVLLFGGGFGLLLFMGVLDLKIPDLSSAGEKAATGARTLIAWLGGLALMAGGGWLLYQSVVKFSTVYAVLGLASILVGLGLVGVIAGLPEFMGGILDLLNNLIGLLNALLEAVSKGVGS